MPITSNIDGRIQWLINVGINPKTPKGCGFMNTLGHLEKLLMQGKITEEEYKEKKTVYIETLLDLYIRDIITKDELYEKLNQ